MASKLSEEVSDKVEALIEKGDELLETEKFTEAYDCYVEALEMLPEPVHENEEATWLFVSLGDSYFYPGDFGKARDAFREAARCPEGLGNPYIHLRLGQCAFELKHLDRAADEFIRAYEEEGEQIFEDEDPKYLEFLQTRIKT
jgi:tetratricopeptide (TPR) repeat protein